MYAIIQTGGKQYRVTTGDVLSIEKLEGNVGQKITFKDLLLVGGKTDNSVLVGTPFVDKATLEAEIVEHSKGEKIRIIKYRRRKGYRRQMGHRQLLTRVLITKIEDGKGGKLDFDNSKRAEVLTKASVKFSDRAERRAQKAAPAEKTSKPKTTKKASTSKK